MKCLFFVRLSRPVRCALLAVVPVLALACASPQEEEEGAADEAEVNAKAPKLCAAVRGNGQHIVTHFASLARITEHYGVVDGIAGGSSGSITSFLYDSMRKNPAIDRCGGGQFCSKDEKAARVSLALKSVIGYANAVNESPEAQAIRDLASLGTRLRSEVEARGIAALVSSDTPAAAAKLREVLSIPEILPLVNPEVFTMLADVAHLRFNVNEIMTSITTLGAFSVDDNRLFFRAGILNWEQIASLFGRVADFYAGVNGADRAAMSSWLDVCAEPARGLEWDAVAATPMPSSGTCGEAFGMMVRSYRDAVRASNAPSIRLGERISQGSTVKKLVTTSVLEGKAVAKWEAARTAYKSGAHETGNIPFDPSFDDVKVGFWGSDADLQRVLSNPKGFTDLKTKKTVSLGDGTWKEVLERSPAEPGLSRFVPLPDGRISGGGWADLAPVLVLKNAGCENVVYVTREGDESGFATKIAKHLGMTERDWQGLFDLATETSGFTQSVAAAEGVWCTQWNSFESLQQIEMARDSYNAQLEKRATFALEPLRPYSAVTDRTGRPGCTPGVAGTATYPR